MTASSAPFTVTTLIAAATSVLEDAGFEAVESSRVNQWRAIAARVYEDAYSIVCVAVYETWAELASGWTEDQGALVDLISKHFSRTEAKAWEGYLVLLTPSIVPASERMRTVEIRRNTLHLRKLLAAGEELQSLDDVGRTLLPLLPLEENAALEPRNILDALPGLLARHGIDEEATKAALVAAQDGHPIIEYLHTMKSDNRGPAL